MATSGYFYTSGWSDATCTDCYIFSWSLSSQNVEGNYSVISWSLKGAGGVDGYWTNVKEKYVTVNGSTQSNSTIQQTYNGTVAFSGTTTIYHNSDGTKSFSASAGGAFYSYGSYNSTGSGTWELPAIPRSSTMSFGEFTMGTAGTITITPANASFTHTISYHFGNKTGTIVSKTSSTSISWTPPLNDFASQIPNDVRGYGSLTITTYSGSTTIGSKKYTMYCNLPASIVPTVGTITLDPVNITTSDGTSRNILVQGKNKIGVSVSGCSAGTGSSIKSYTFTGPNLSKTTTSTSVESNIVTSSGTLTYTVTVTDTRGRTASKTATITSYAYSAPSFKSFAAYRSDANGNANDAATYAKCDYTLSYSSVNGTNNITVKIYYKKNSVQSYSSTTVLSAGTSTSGSKILSSIAADSGYTIYATITDNYGGSSQSSVITVVGAARTFNITSDGTGVAIGKMAESTELLDCRWAIRTDEPEQTMKNLTYRGQNILSTTDDTSANWVAMGNLATVYYNTTGKINGQPTQYGYLLNITAGPDSTQVHQLWAQQPNGALFHRGGNTSSGFGTTWKEVVDSSNYKTVIGPVSLYSNSSGTTGTVTLSDSAANYSYLEIFLSKDTNSGWWSVKVPSPNGKVAQVGTTYYTNASGVGLQVIGKTVTISGTSITPGTEFYMNFNDSTGAVKAIGGQTSIKIMKVDGYK